MPPLNQEEVSQENETFDFNTLIAETAAKAVADDESGETGEDDELSGPTDQVGELDEGDAYEVPEFEDDPAHEEDEPLEEEDRVDPPEEPEAEAKAPPRDEEIEQLKGLVFEGQKQIQTLLDILRAKEAPTKQEQPKEPDLPHEIVKMALFEGNTEKWNKLPPEQQAKGRKFAQEYIDNESRYAADPGKRYEEQIRDRVMEDVRAMLQPVMVDQTDRKSQAIIEKYTKDIPQLRGRVAEVFKTLPGSRSADWQDLEAAFKVATDYVRLESKDQKISSRERKLTAAERQREANRRAARRQSPRGSGKAPPAKTKGWTVEQSLFDFAKNLENGD